MSVLALKALGYGAEQIPDKVFEKIPGGYFTPPHKKGGERGRQARKEKRRKEREQQRGHTPPSDCSDDSAYDDSDRDNDTDSDYNRKRRQSRGSKRDDRRSRRNTGKSSKRSATTSDVDEEYSHPAMSYAEQGGYRPYDSTPSYGHPAQVNSYFSSRSATYPLTPQHPTPVNSCPPTLMNRTSSLLSPALPFSSPSSPLSRGTPVSAAFTPSYEPPLAALLQRHTTNSLQQGTAPQRDYPPSSTASRYTPGPGYAPSPASPTIPHPPVGPNATYAPYNPADYAPPSGYQAPGNAYPSPPPFDRRRSNSQPPYNPAYPAAYVPVATTQLVSPHDAASSRRDSTKPRRGSRHRARSADSHRTSDSHRGSSRMAKVRERFDGIDARERSLAAAVGGALAGGLAGKQFGKSRLTALAGAAAGAIGGRALADKQSK